jgi:hypothetical protein
VDESQRLITFNAENFSPPWARVEQFASDAEALPRRRPAGLQTQDLEGPGNLPMADGDRIEASGEEHHTWSSGRMITWQRGIGPAGIPPHRPGSRVGRHYAGGGTAEPPLPGWSAGSTTRPSTLGSQPYPTHDTVIGTNQVPRVLDGDPWGSRLSVLAVNIVNQVVSTSGPAIGVCRALGT